MRRRFDLVVFDWDGTLADSTSVIVQALQRACRDTGCDVPGETAARYVIGLGLSDALRHVAPGLDAADYPRLSGHYRTHFLACEAEIPLFAGARELLDSLLASGHQLAVATGKSRIGLDRTLAQHRLGHVFHATRCGDEGRPKPHPEMLNHILERLGVSPARALMVGDTTHDLEMAASAGVAAVAMTQGAHDIRQLASATSLGAVATLEELNHWLRNSQP